VFVKSISLLGSIVWRFWRRTIDWRAVYFDPRADTVHPGSSQRYVFAGWHEYMLMPILLRANRQMLALASEHVDGEYISLCMKHLGWCVARGSTTRGGVKAFMQMMRDEQRHLNLTPDGPRGPRREMSIGPIALASKIGRPLVCVGYGYNKPWRGRGWDRFAVPKPFSRARAVFGPPLLVPPKLNRDELESYRAWFGDLLNWLTDEAEEWATSGIPKQGSLPMLIQEAPRGMANERQTPSLTLPPELNERWQALQQKPIRRTQREAA